MDKLFTWQPDWRSLKRKLSCESTVSRLLRGAESRRRHSARMLTGYTFSLSLNRTAAASLRLFVDTLNGGRVQMPDWCRGGRVVTAAGTALVLEPGDPILTAVTAGDRLLLRRAWNQTETAEVVSVAADTITLAAAVKNEIVPFTGATAFPLLSGYLEADPPTLTREDDQSFRTEITFTEAFATPSVVAWQEPSFSGSVERVYFLLFVDTTGSMPDAQITAIQTAFSALKDMIRDSVYEGDQALADEYVRLYNNGGENWLAWMGSTVRDELSSRYFVAAFINESASVYHLVPRYLSREPTSSYLWDYALMEAEFARRDFSVGRVYAVDPGPTSSWENDYDAFREQVADAVAGNNGYAPLRAFNISLVDEIQADESAEFYFNDILNAVMSYGAI